jgi:hypothetical protein
VDIAVLHKEPPYTHRPIEAPRTGTIGIEIQNLVLEFLFGYVTVSVDYCSNACSFRLQIELI